MTNFPFSKQLPTASTEILSEGAKHVSAAAWPDSVGTEVQWVFRRVFNLELSTEDSKRNLSQMVFMRDEINPFDFETFLFDFMHFTHHLETYKLKGIWDIFDKNLKKL